jgi:hypothetical protein
MQNPPVSLSKVRKARAKSERRAQADANAVKFGRTKAARKLDEANDAATRGQLDGHKRDDAE